MSWSFWFGRGTRRAKRSQMLKCKNSISTQTKSFHSGLYSASRRWVNSGSYFFAATNPGTEPPPLASHLSLRDRLWSVGSLPEGWLWPPATDALELWRDIKARIMELVDTKQILPLWIIDEAQNLPNDFFRDCPAFINFAFDSRDLMSVWLVGHPALAITLDRAPHAALAGRIQARVHLEPIIERERFKALIDHALQSAGCPPHTAGGLRYGTATTGITGVTSSCRAHPQNRHADGRAQGDKPLAG